MNVKDKLVVVTGGARRLGRAIVEAMASDGARVVVHCHQSLEEGKAVARDVGGHLVQADLSLPNGAAELTKQVEALLQREETELAAWVNAAASFEQTPFLDSDDELWQRTLQLVVLSPAAALRRMAPKMVEGGVVINLLDVAAHRPWKGYAHHCVAKAGLAMLTRTLALELAPRLRACGVSPGVVMPPDDAPKPALERWRNQVPLRRLGSPGDVVEAVRYLIGADYVTGVVLPVDGGRLAAYPTDHH